MRKNLLLIAFPRDYSAASTDEQGMLRVWTREFKQDCKFIESARISLETKMLPYHISIINPLGRIDNVALRRSASSRWNSFQPQLPL